MSPNSTERDRAEDDLALRQQLRNLPPAASGAEIEALNRSVLEQWRQQHGPASGSRGGAAVRAAQRGRRPWLVGSAALAACLALAVGLWLQRGDAALDDLLRPDVLSQMAAGEM